MMVADLVTSAASGPASEAISQTIEIIFEILYNANGVLVKKDSFKEVAAYLERLVPILKELSKKNVTNYEGLDHAIEILNREIRKAKQLTLDCSKRNKVYLLMKCRSIVKRLEDTTREISWSLGLLPMASMGLSSGIIEDVKQLCDNMQRAEFKAAIAEENILDKIESGIQERTVDSSYANNLLRLIAEAVGISTDRSAMKLEFEDFKSEIENVRLRKDQAEAIQMDQIIALLERADVASSPEEKELKYLTKRKSLGSQPLEPLQSFYCPITQDVMVDPVETSSGQTFERNAIEKWFAEGNNLCPMTMTPLDTSVLRSNKTLKQSIEEWKDRNTMITIASMKEKLQSEDEEERLLCLEELQDLCEKRDEYREWVILENYIPTLIRILSAKSHDGRNNVLVILCMLAKHNDDAKERILKVDNAIESIVRSLGRRVRERTFAVALLLEISKKKLVREYIGKVQGCILLLVTMSSSDDTQAGRDATELLGILSFSDQNVIQMAKANYFKYMLQRLSTGPEDVKMIMAKSLAEMELTDHNREALFEGGVLGPLLRLLSHGDIQIKGVAVKALQNLSSLPKNGLEMVREGAVRPLLDLLFHPTSLSSSLGKHVAATIKQLAVLTISQDDQIPVLLLESDDDIVKLFSLIKFMGPDVQQNIILTFHALCQSPSATNIKFKLLECSAVQVLVQLCGHEDPNVRANAVNLFCCLIESCDEATILENVNQRYIETLLLIMESSHDEEEIASALGIIYTLPEVPQITQWLLDSGALQLIFAYLPQDGKQKDPQNSKLIENAVGAICRFTVPTNLEWQKSVAEIGVIRVLVQLLESGSTLTKKRAAFSLARFSENSVGLSRPIPKSKGLWCFSTPAEVGCSVHGGFCTIKSSFCLVEANAVGPLVRILGESDPGACEASLDALLTLIDGERLQRGTKVLSEENAIPLMIRFLSSPSPGLQEKSLHALERIFRLVEFKQMYGASAQMPLVDLTQRGTGSTKSLAARILAHLNVLHDQSSYF
ncbi:RING-type E3 ubiquitin transferase [Quillaja saponaria]|uniref:RING-type E3 ubiquitin transferase n=1 Tax=Quillaja saponaria TaxID=32244 RepID=A0AAD7PNT4_QUISA|nr:RING-type E3 ubiquitin transferase [Quillaja saponaria]